MDKHFELSRYLAENESELVICRIMDSYGYYQERPHLHRHYELLYIKEGEYTVECCGKIIKSNEPLLLLYSPFTLHRISVPENSRYVRYIFPFSRQLGSMISPALVDFSVLQQANMISIVPDASMLEQLNTLVEECLKVRRQSGQLSLMMLVFLRYVLDLLVTGCGEVYKWSFTYIQDALQYMTDHLSEAPTALELAEKYGVSKTKFHHDFLEMTGSSYHDFLSEMRMNYAKSLLRHGASIIETALEVGYSGEASFIYAFRQHFGITPGEFRRSLDT